MRRCKENRGAARSTHPAGEGGPGGDPLAEVPQDPDDDDAGLEAIGSSLVMQYTVSSGQ